MSLLTISYYLSLPMTRLIMRRGTPIPIRIILDDKIIQISPIKTIMLFFHLTLHPFLLLASKIIKESLLLLLHLKSLIWS